MIHRFNSTGRIRIPRDTILIRVTDDPAGGPARFSADLSALAGLKLPKTAAVVVEPYVRQSSMRFDFGTVGSLAHPTDTLLTEVDRGEAVHFRVKVVDPSAKPGRLLALADQVAPADESEDADRKAILPIHITDLGEAIWKIDASPEAPPSLKLNIRVPQLRARLDEDPLLRGVIFPACVREVMRVLLFEEPDASVEWVEDWKAFGESLLGEPLPEDAEADPAGYAVLDRLVEAFCDRQRWATAATPVLPQLEEDYE